MDEAKVPNYRYLLTEAFKRNRPHEVRALIERDSAWVRVALYDIWDSERESRHSRDRCAGCGPIGCVSFLHSGTRGWRRPPTVVAAKRTKLIYSHPFHPSAEDWEDDNDHCYSIYFRIAIGQGVLSKSEAEDLMARLHGPAPNAFVDNLFPHGAEVLALGAKIHKTTVESELRALEQDDQPIDKVMLVTGRSALQR